MNHKNIDWKSFSVLRIHLWVFDRTDNEIYLKEQEEEELCTRVDCNLNTCNDDIHRGYFMRCRTKVLKLQAVKVNASNIQ